MLALVAGTVAALLPQGFRLAGNTRTLEGKQHPDRDAQFRCLNEQVKDHQATGDPVTIGRFDDGAVKGPFKNYMVVVLSMIG